MTEDEMAGWHHRLDELEFEETPGVGDGQRGLACCNSWGRKESDTTEQLNWTESKAIDRFPKFLIHFLAKFVFNFKVILSDIKVVKTKLSLYCITMKLKRTLRTSNPCLQNVSMNLCPILPTFQGTKPLYLGFIIYKVHRGIHMPTFYSPC